MDGIGRAGTTTGALLFGAVVPEPGIIAPRPRGSVGMGLTTIPGCEITLVPAGKFVFLPVTMPYIPCDGAGAGAALFFLPVTSPYSPPGCVRLGGGVPTICVYSPVLGGRGATYHVGGLTTRGMVYQVFQ